MGETGERFNLDNVKIGLCSVPRHVSDDLQWITEEGQKLFQERDKTASFYRKDELSMVLGMSHITDSLPEKLVIIDLGAGKTSKSAAMLRSLIQGHPTRKICFIPIDLSDCIHGWREYLDQEYPDVSQQVVEVFPTVMDMVESLGHITEILENTEYTHWEKLYCSFGPNTLFLHNNYWNNVVKRISQCICEEGHGYFAYSYVPWNETTVTNMTESLYSQVNLPGIMHCIFKGLNKLTHGDLDPNNFEFKSEFILDIPTEDGLGKWAGWAMYAEATCDIHATFKKLNLEVDIKKGEKIRLSEDVVKSHYKTESYMTTLASHNGLKVVGNWTEGSGLLSTMVLQFDDSKAYQAVSSATVKIFTS